MSADYKSDVSAMIEGWKFTMTDATGKDVVCAVETRQERESWLRALSTAAAHCLQQGVPVQEQGTREVPKRLHMSGAVLQDSSNSAFVEINGEYRLSDSGEMRNGRPVYDKIVQVLCLGSKFSLLRHT